jgi:hypothetical protein
MSFIETRKPTEHELTHCERYELTSPKPWEPHVLNLTSGLDANDDPTWVIGEIRTHCRKDPPELSISAFKRLMQCKGSPSDRAEPRVIHDADVISIDVEHHEAMATTIGSRNSTITKEDLAKRWFIGLDTAARTLDATTQMGMRYVEGPFERRLRTSQVHMQFLTLNIRTYTDTMFSNKMSICGYSCAQVFTDGHHFCRVYPLHLKGGAHHALMSFIHEVGIPRTMHSDLALEETRGEWAKIIKQYHINQTTTEAKSPWQNRAEAEIRILKKVVRHLLRQAGAIMELWCYAIEWAARVRSLTAHDSLILNCQTLEERVSGRTPDILEFAHYGWYDWVWFREETSFPEENLCLGIWLGVPSKVGQAMTDWVMTSKGSVIACSSVTHLTDSEQ